MTFEPSGATGRVDIDGFGWRHAGRKNPAISNVNLQINPGEKVLLLGASGAGKSTLLAGIAGVLGDAEDGEQQGRLTIDGLDPTVARGRVGMVIQDPDSQVIASQVGDDVVFGCENLGRGRKEMWQRARDALQTVGLGHLPLEHPTVRLSGGQKQRLALAGVLAMRPRVIVLDEPTANLDPDGVIDVRDTVLRSCEELGSTLIVVEHRVDIWSDHVDRVIVLGSNGALKADGSADQVLSSQAEQLADVGIWIPGLPPEVEPVSSMRDSRSQPIMSVTDLGIGWAGHPIRSEITADLRTGSTCLTGENGCGKSTLALTLAGLHPAVTGTIDASPLKNSADRSQAQDKPPHRGGAFRRRRKQVKEAHNNLSPYHWRSRDLVRRIGYVFQDPEHQFVARTVRDELLIGPQTVGMDAAAAEKRADELLSALGLKALGPANPFTLSGGEKRRLSVAAILATQPELLILDEPTFGQDRKTFTVLVQLLQNLADRGTSLLSITHDDVYLSALGQHHWHLPSGHGIRVQEVTA